MIALERIGRTALLGELFEQIVVPPAVAREIGPGPWPPWVVEGGFVGADEPGMRSLALDPGEREAVVLALELEARLLLMDDLRGRKTAQAFDIPIIGTAGILLEAKLAGLVPELRPLLDEVVASGFHLDWEIAQGLLSRAGEVDPITG